MHAHPPVKPYQVHLRCVQFTSYRFLQTLPLPATPLRFGLSSPWSGRRLFLSTGRVCPLRWANKKGGHLSMPPFPFPGQVLLSGLFLFAQGDLPVNPILLEALGLGLEFFQVRLALDAETGEWQHLQPAEGDLLLALLADPV